MNIVEVMERVDRSDYNEYFIELGVFAEMFNINNLYGEYSNGDRLKSYWIIQVWDTDEYVGERIYELDGELVAYSKQVGRTYDENFYWLGEKEYRDVRTYLLSLVDEISDIDIQLLNKSLDIDETYRVSYNESVKFETGAYYGGDFVDIVNFISEGPTSNRVLIEFSDGETLEVLVSDLEFPIRIS